MKSSAVSKKYCYLSKCLNLYYLLASTFHSPHSQTSNFCSKWDDKLISEDVSGSSSMVIYIESLPITSAVCWDLSGGSQVWIRHENPNPFSFWESNRNINSTVNIAKQTKPPGLNSMYTINLHIHSPTAQRICSWCTPKWPKGGGRVWCPCCAALSKVMACNLFLGVFSLGGSF